jgi:ribosome-binding factor A
VLKALVHATPFLRSYLAPRLGTRIVPTLTFHIDKSIETGTRIEQLLRDLDRPAEGE